MTNAVALFDPINSGATLKTAAKEMGFKVVAVYTKPIQLFKDQYHITEEVLFQDCDEVIIAQDREEILKRLKASPFKIQAAIPGLDSGVELADQIAHDLKLFRNSIGLSSARRDKGKMRQVIKRSGFSCPDFSLCQTEKKLAEFLKSHPFPVVIKTPRGAATSQVFVCDDEKSALNAFYEIRTKEDFFGDKARYAVIEEYISGKEYIVNTFSDGKEVHVTDVWVYDKIETENFKNVYYSAVTIPLSNPEIKPLIEHGANLSKAFGLKRGPAHLEFKDDPLRGPTLIEINARLCGAKLPDFMKKYTNFDPYRATIEVFAYGSSVFPAPLTFHKHFAIACCPVFKSGKIRKISGIEEIKRLSSYEMHSLSIKEGDIISSTTYSTTTPLFVYLAHEDRQKMLDDLKKAHELFSVEFV
jgi:biotin carboxylase